MWGVHSNVRDAIQSLAHTAAYDGPGQSSSASPAVACWQPLTAAARERFAQCMMGELTRCTWASPSKAARTVRVHHANIQAALKPASKCEDICTVVSREILKNWAVYSKMQWIAKVGRVAGLLLPSLEQLCEATAPWTFVEEGKRHTGSEEGRDTGSLRLEEWVSKSVSLRQDAGKEPQLIPTEMSKKLDPRLLQQLSADLIILRKDVLMDQGQRNRAAKQQKQVLEPGKWQPSTSGSKQPNKQASTSLCSPGGSGGPAQVRHASPGSPFLI